MKRLFDVSIASMALLLLSPVMVIVALAIFLADRGPPLFGQTRVGRDGRHFSLLKFRSMVVNAERAGGYSTGSADPRITPVGRLLRRSSIDELPQLFNVLTGDMSLIGPRPDVPAQQVQYSEEEWALRTSVKPGITGLAQAKLRSTATLAQRTELDLTYARSTSFKQDVKILLMTFGQLFKRSGN